jgi:biotin operon repressor
MKNINDFIKKNPNLSSKEGAEKCGISRQAYRTRKSRLGIKEETKSEKGSVKDRLHSMISKSKKRHSLVDLAKTFNEKIHTIEKVIKELEAEGINIYRHQNEIEISNQINKSDASVISNHHLVGERVKFGFVTDNHLCSKYERLDVLNALYKRFEKEGIKTVYNAGNVIDGEARFNKFDIHTYGMENQCNYFARVYPQIKGIDTYFITGDRRLSPLNLAICWKPLRD